LSDKDGGVACMAVSVLGRLGPVAEKAVPVLIEGLKKGELRSAAIDALGKIGP
jgi:hypothetical protein